MQTVPNFKCWLKLKITITGESFPFLRMFFLSLDKKFLQWRFMTWISTPETINSSRPRTNRTVFVFWRYFRRLLHGIRESRCPTHFLLLSLIIREFLCQFRHQRPSSLAQMCSESDEWRSGVKATSSDMVWEFLNRRRRLCLFSCLDFKSKVSQMHSLKTIWWRHLLN